MSLNLGSHVGRPRWLNLLRERKEPLRLQNARRDESQIESLCNALVGRPLVSEECEVARSDG